MAFAVWIGFEVCKFVLVQILHGVMKSDVYLTGYLGTLLGAAIAFLIFIIVFRKYLPSPRRHYGDKTTMWKLFFLCIVIGISKLFAQRIMNIPLLYMGDWGQTIYTPEMLENVLNAGNNPIVLTYVSLIGPVLEELFYRGVLLTMLSKTMKKSSAILISALIFGISHLNLMQFWSAFILGLVCGYIFLLSEDIRLAIIIHITGNSFLMLLQIWQDRNWQNMQITVGRTLLEATVGLGILCGSLWLIRKIFEKEQKLVGDELL